MSGSPSAHEQRWSPSGLCEPEPTDRSSHARLFTGFVAAIAWSVAWKRSSWFSAAAVGAALGAMALHSVNDVIALDEAEKMRHARIRENAGS